MAVQILGKSASKDQDVEIPSSIREILDKDDRAQEFVVLPLDSFWLDNKDEHLCTVTELYGPHLYKILDEEQPTSAAWTRKVFRETLEALAFLHSQGIVHGCKWSPPMSSEKAGSRQMQQSMSGLLSSRIRNSTPATTRRCRISIGRRRQSSVASSIQSLTKQGLQGTERL